MQIANSLCRTLSHTHRNAYPPLEGEVILYIDQNLVTDHENSRNTTMSHIQVQNYCFGSGLKKNSFPWLRSINPHLWPRVLGY